MILQVFLDVGLRTFYNNPLPATLEIVSYWWMVALSFLGLAYAKVRHEHISVNLLSESVPPKVKTFNDVFIEVVVLVVVALIAYFSFIASLDALETGESASGLFSIPVWPARFFIPIGTALYFAASLVSLIKGIALTVRGGSSMQIKTEEVSHD